MNVNVKTESLEIGSVVDLSSDEEGDTVVSSQKKEISQEIAIIKQPERPRTPETICSICLEELNNKCYSNACWHLFCFDCLKRWSAIQPSCPLCKKEFRCIYHTITSQSIHETFDVPIRVMDFSSRSFFYSNSDTNSIFRMNLFLDIVRRNERLMNNLSNSINDQDSIPTPTVDPQLINLHPSIDNTLYNGRREFSANAMRMRVYNDNLWADPLPDLSGRFRECSCVFYRENPTQTFRLHSFIHRDLQAVRSIERSEGFLRSEYSFSEESIIGLILQTISRYDIRDVYMVNLLRPYIGPHSPHFVHELYNFAHSPYDLVGYDRNVRYSIRPLLPPTFYPSGLNVRDVFEETSRRRSPIPMPLPLASDPRLYSETIVLDTDDEEDGRNSRLFGQEVIIVSSTNEDDSDVEILSHSYHPLETLDNFRDQPSTSTGIRDSLDRPNNRYNLRRRRLFPPILNDSIVSCPVNLSRLTRNPTGLRRGRIILDSSSSEDDSFTPNRNSQTIHMKSAVILDKKKRKVKKKKLRKRKRTVDDSRPELRTGSRSRSNSGSSSSFSDTDTRPNNNCLPLRTNIVL